MSKTYVQTIVNQSMIYLHAHTCMYYISLRMQLIFVWSRIINTDIEIKQSLSASNRESIHCHLPGMKLFDLIEVGGVKSLCYIYLAYIFKSDTGD